MPRRSPSFFIDGPAKDLGYTFTRDNPQVSHRKAYVENLWQRYSPYADYAFREDARNHFLQRFWEMYLAVALLDKGLVIKKHGNEGPEFSVQIAGKKIWIEAIAPTPGDGPDYVPECPSGIARRVPVEKILLRFTNALASKKNNYETAIAKGIIAPEDPYILAINSRGIPGAPYGNTIPYFVQAFLPFGPLTVSIDTKSNQITETFYRYRPLVEKSSGAKVSTKAFLDSDMAFCSAVIHSAVDAANIPTQIGSDFSVLHNPVTPKTIPNNVFHWCTQYELHGNELRTIE